MVIRYAAKRRGRVRRLRFVYTLTVGNFVDKDNIVFYCIENPVRPGFKRSQVLKLSLKFLSKKGICHQIIKLFLNLNMFRERYFLKIFEGIFRKLKLHLSTLASFSLVRKSISFWISLPVLIHYAP